MSDRDFWCPHYGACDRDENGKCRVLAKLIRATNRSTELEGRKATGLLRYRQPTRRQMVGKVSRMLQVRRAHGRARWQSLIEAAAGRNQDPRLETPRKDRPN